MKRETNTSAAIREILKQGPHDFYALLEKVEAKTGVYPGRHALRTLLSVMQANDKDVQGSGRGRERVYALVKPEQA